MIRFSLALMIVFAALVGVVAVQPHSVAEAACLQYSGDINSFYLNKTDDFEATAGTPYTINVIGDQGQQVGAQIGYFDSATQYFIWEIPNYGIGSYSESGTLGTSPSGVYRILLINPSALSKTATWTVTVGCDGGAPAPLPAGVSEAESASEAVAYETAAGNVDLYGACVDGSCSLLVRFDPDVVVALVDAGSLTPGSLAQAGTGTVNGFSANVYYLGEHHQFPNTAVFQINQYQDGTLIDDSILIFYNRTNAVITLQRK